MNTILIRNISLKNRIVDILIEDNYFKQIEPNIEAKADKIIDGTDRAIIQPFYNLHTHTSMTLLRGYGDDMRLFQWLSEYIWPQEAKLTPEDIYDGTRLAIVEMIRSGTVFFLDMYWHHQSIIRAVEEMKIRANIGVTFIEERGKKEIEDNINFIRNFKPSSDLINISVAPHAIYTCGKDLYQELHNLSREKNIKLNTHLAETAKEVRDCKKANNNLTPIEYLDSIGILDENTIAAHCVHLSENDADILGDRGVTLVHNPCSNMKLASGAFNVPLVDKYDCRVCLGTDGTSSNNNLSMQEEMKFAALLAKVSYNDTSLLSANEIFAWATKNGAEAMGINAGKIKEGKLADCLIIDLNNDRLIPNHNLISNWVYSADSRCIETVICNGNILMENHIIPNEAEILNKAKRTLS
ncbi:MAG: amidohydrolase [Bacteroidales bacterium]|jgi:5-methylthioadenosine/S-adenosylhomocysteine deaminase